MSGGLSGIPRGDAVVAAWKAAAIELDGDYGAAMHWQYPVVQTRAAAGVVTLELVPTGNGFATRARAPFHNPDRISLAVGDERVFTSFFKALGFVQDIELGHPRFDARFVVRGFPKTRVRELLASPVVDLLAAQPFVDLRILSGSPHVPYPEGVAELRLQRGTVVRDTSELVGMATIVLALLDRVDPLAVPAEGSVEQLMGRLVRSGGTVANPWTRTVLWDGSPLRRDAARQLGALGDPVAVPSLVSVLDDADDQLVAEAIRALAALGDPRAVPPLVRMLGRRGDHVDGASLADLAGEALASLGRGPLVAAVDRALSGDPSGLRTTVGASWPDVVHALMTVLDSYDLEARVEAATALGELGARESLPLLREKTKAMGLRTKLTEAAREAIARIESQASLPRPAQGGVDVPDTLPRPARDGGTNPPRRETLPRAVNRDDPV